ncbi:MAG: hypothetical protein NVSMB13_18930 [Mycobacteriales bacterium]
MPRRRLGRKPLYFTMMGTAITLFVLAFSVVRLFSVPLAVGMCVVAAVIPPVAAIITNLRPPPD